MTKMIPKPKLIKSRENEDPLDYLIVLFDQVELDEGYSDYSDSDSEYDSDSDSSEEPRSKDYYDSKYCFSVSNCLYYFDDDRNVYLEDGTLVHDSSLCVPSDNPLTPSFYINGTSYWFGADNELISQDESGTLYSVQTWQREPEVFDLLQFLNQPPAPTENSVVLQFNLNSESVYTSQIPAIVSTPAAYDGTLGTATKALSPNAVSGLFQQGSHDQATKLALSPTSSAFKSPIVPASSPAPSEEPSLFLASQPGNAQGVSLISAWKQDVKQAQQAAIRARPVKKPNKEDNRRCPICGKLLRRPGGLEEHLNIHSGAKPHKCPFKKCNAGFATKSNLSRHFLTHQLGPLKDYHPGMAYEPDSTKSERGSRAPIATYNSKAHHNGRFRIARQTGI